LLTAVVVGGHQHAAEDHNKDDKALLVLEIETDVNSGSKDKRSPQHVSSQAEYGVSPGQFVVRTGSPTEGSQPDVPPEYLSLLQQQGDGAQPPSQPVLQQLLVARYSTD
jgi:hypothetical protein